MTEQNMINIIDKIADKLSVPVSEIINAYILYGYKDFILAIVFIIVSIICLIGSYYISKKDIELGALTFIYSCLPIVMSTVHIINTIMWINNPKGYAILEIMKHLK